MLLATRQRRLRLLGHVLRLPERWIVRRALMALSEGGARNPEEGLFLDCQPLSGTDGVRGKVHALLRATRFSLMASQYDSNEETTMGRSIVNDGIVDNIIIRPFTVITRYFTFDSRRCFFSHDSAWRLSPARVTLTKLAAGADDLHSHCFSAQ